MQNNESFPVANKQAWWKTAFHILLPLVLLGIFAWQIWDSRGEIVSHPWAKMHWGFAAASLGLLLVNSLLEILIWNRALGWFTVPLPFPLATPAFVWSTLARYIPGKVASLLIRVALTSEMNRHPVPVLASSLMDLTLRTASALLIALVTLSTWGQVARDKFSQELLGIPIGIIVIILVVAHPRLMIPAMNWVLRRCKRAPIERKLRYRDVLGLLVAVAGRWSLYGLAFALLACAIFPEAQDHMIALIGIANAAWAAGFLGMSPGGLGIAEFVQKVALHQSLGFSAAVALILPVLWRLWTLVAEGLWALVSWALLRSHTARQVAPAPVPETMVD
ncbi:MAG: lysylphosphatidylglycerol synthase domain-containing protein [Armatimonadota bacterium]